MDALDKQMITWDEELERSTERIFQKLRATLTSNRNHKQFFGVQFEQQFALF